MIQKDRVPQMHASIKTATFRGIDTILVEVQVHVANGLPALDLMSLLNHLRGSQMLAPPGGPTNSRLR